MPCQGSFCAIGKLSEGVGSRVEKVSAAFSSVLIGCSSLLSHRFLVGTSCLGGSEDMVFGLSKYFTPRGASRTTSLSKSKKDREPLTCLLLVSYILSTPGQESDQRRCRNILQAKGIAVKEIDGGDPENVDKRNFLFKLSGQRGIYPLVFLCSASDHYKFVGTWSNVEELIELSDLPQEFLNDHPEISTFDKIFERATRQNPYHNLPERW